MTNPIAKSLRSPKCRQKIVQDKRAGFTEVTEQALEDMLPELYAARRARELAKSMASTANPEEAAIRAFLN